MARLEAAPDADADTDTIYMHLLDNVVRVARRTAFPSHGSFDMHGMLHVLPPSGEEEAVLPGDSLRVRSSSQLERDKKIGAAGELFVGLLCHCASLDDLSYN